MNVKCDDKLSFDECELTIVRSAVSYIQNHQGKKKLNTDTTRSIIRIVEDFISKYNCICYGGTAINNILPKKHQFYNKNVEFPDYDVFTPNAIKYTKLLANIFYESGFHDVEAKSGIHSGTYKIYVNFIPTIDITYIDPVLYSNLLKDSIIKQNILYAPPNFLRMSMYLELSRPNGNISRWEKITQRLSLLNKYFPIKHKRCSLQKSHFRNVKNTIEFNQIFDILMDLFIKKKVVFFGSFAFSFFMKSHPNSNHNRRKINKIPDFDILSENALELVESIQTTLSNNEYNVIITHQKPFHELIAKHYEIRIDNTIVAIIYEPIACHSYNEVKYNKHKIRIASIDTMLSYYLAFIYTNRDYFDVNRILCMCEYLFEIQQKNRLSQKGILKRFSMKCLGKQTTIEDIRSQKTLLYEKFHSNKQSPDYEKHFLRYIPRYKFIPHSSSLQTKKNKITNKNRNKTSRNKFTRTEFTNT